MRTFINWINPNGSVGQIFVDGLLNADQLSTIEVDMFNVFVSGFFQNSSDQYTDGTLCRYLYAAIVKPIMKCVK